MRIRLQSANDGACRCGSNGEAASRRGECGVVARGSPSGTPQYCDVCATLGHYGDAAPLQRALYAAFFAYAPIASGKDAARMRGTVARPRDVS